MKVLQLVKYYDPCKGGMETVVKNIVEGIIESRKDVGFTVYSNSHFVAFHKTSQTKNREIIIKEVTPFLLKSQPLNLWYPGLKKLLVDADVVNHHYPFPTMELGLVKNLHILKKKKFVITWHANIENSRWRLMGMFYNPLIKILLKICSNVVVTSPQLFENSKILQKYAEKVIVIPLSFDPQITSNSSQPRIFPKDRKFKLLFIGKLREYKGVKYLIEAIADLDVDLAIVGDGEKETELKELVSRLKISNKVSFHSNVSNMEIVQFYDNSDLFVLPSINEAEAFGVVQLEAMANGLPVINTRLDSGVPFVSLHNYSGITVEPASADSLKSAIEKIIKNKELYELFSKNSLERVKEFSREKMSETYLNLYKLTE